MSGPIHTKLVAEKEALDGNIQRLGEFTRGEKFGTLEPQDQYDLNEQYDAMIHYSSILQRRIVRAERHGI